MFSYQELITYKHGLKSKSDSSYILLFNIILSKLDALGPAFLQLLDTLPTFQKVAFWSLVSTDDLFVRPKSPSSQKCFKFRKQVARFQTSVLSGFGEQLHLNGLVHCRGETTFFLDHSWKFSLNCFFQLLQKCLVFNSKCFPFEGNLLAKFSWHPRKLMLSPFQPIEWPLHF